MSRRAAPGEPHASTAPGGPSAPSALGPERAAAFRALAEATEGIDAAVYAQCGRDWRDPIVGLGAPDARIGFFGRDPGRTEVRHAEPFVGAGGQLLRRALWRRLRGPDAGTPSLEESIAVGRDFFWINTVPYKPVGNKAWPMAVKRRFHPLVRGLLAEAWHGRTLLTLGREAFLWFGIGQPAELRQRLEDFWAGEDRFARTIEVPLPQGDGDGDSGAPVFTLCPLPHPSPLNQTWYRRFPALLDARLEALDVRPGRLRLRDGAGG
ncbi:MAG: uracil-DNA glycosylase family protein [Xylophilus ampelinus]